jgi:hypothetical protein
VVVATLADGPHEIPVVEIKELSWRKVLDLS